MKQPQNVTIQIDPFTLSLAQEEGCEKVEVAVLINDTFVPAYLWSDETRRDTKTVSYIGGRGLADIIAAVEKLAAYDSFALGMRDEPAE